MKKKEEILQGMEKVEFFFRCRTDFKFFCERMLGVDSYGGIHDYQLRWFRLTQMYERVVIEAPAGFSKTEVMGVMYPLWEMYRSKNLKILLVCKTMEQGKSNMLERIKGYIQDNEFLTEFFVPPDARTTWNKSEIRTKDGHWVKNVPYNNNIRGYRADIIICDEVDSYEETDTYFEHVTSRLFPGGKIILISTPVGPTRLIGQLKEKANMGVIKNYAFEKTQALVSKDGRRAYKKEPSEITIEMLKDCKSIWPENWPVEKLLEKWGEMGKWKWMRNYMCEVIGEAEDAIFPLQNIMDSFDYSLSFTKAIDEGAQYFIGADFAISGGPKADFDAFIVLKKINDQFIVVHSEVHKGWQRPLKVQRLKDLWEHYQTELGTIIVADESNMGTMVINDLRAEGVTVVAQNFHSFARKKLLVTLSNVLQGKGLILPRSMDDEDAQKFSELLKDQLTGFRRKRSEKTGGESIESTAPHDDVAMALAMAVSEGTRHETMGLSPVWA